MMRYNTVLIICSLFLIIFSCKGKEEYQLNHWSLISESDSVAEYQYQMSRKDIYNHVEQFNPDCVTKGGWITCYYLTNARVRFYPTGKAVVDDYQFNIQSCFELHLETNIWDYEIKEGRMVVDSDWFVGNYPKIEHLQKFKMNR